jgi:glycosyltransferase involved in cell wall biosynthesis
MEDAFRQPVRSVMIGSPSYDGRLDVWYTNSLCNTIKESFQHGVDILPMWVSFDALIQRCRNDTVQLAMELDVDDLIFIDTDIEWQPEWVFKLLNYNEDVVGGTYPKKSNNPDFVVRQMTRRSPNRDTGLIEVDGLGTGFLKLSKKAYTALWDSSPSYIDQKDGKERRMIFDVRIEDSRLISEDIYACNQLQKLGFKIWLDPTMVCNHIGSKKYQGDFITWYKRSRPQL